MKTYKTTSVCKQYLKPLFFIFHVTNAQWNQHLYIRHYLSLGFLGGRAWINNLCANTLLGDGDGWPCNSRETGVSGRNELRQERWASTTRWYVIKPAIASAQNRSGRLVMWSGTRKTVFQNHSALDQSIRERKGKQFIYWLFAFSCLSLVKIPCISSPAACTLPGSFWRNQNLGGYRLDSMWP